MNGRLDDFRAEQNITIGRICALALVGALTLLGLVSVSPAGADVASGPGSLDLSFDGDGMAITQVGSFTDQGNAVALQPDGRIVVAGFSESGTGRRFAVVRYNADGSLDTSFDGDGKVTTVIGTGSRDEGNSVALQPDGKIVVAGDSYDASGKSHFAVVRYNADGSLDTSFDGDGKVTTVGTSTARAVAIQGNRLVVAGAGPSPDCACGTWVTLARYTADGSLDPTFAGGGTFVTTVGFSSVAHALAIQDDGRIVVAGGMRGGGSFAAMVLLRYDANGGADSTFGGGAVITDIGTATDTATALDLPADGRIVVAGFAQSGSSFQIAALHHRGDGSLDPAFGGDGIVTTSVGPVSQGFGVAVDEVGRTIVAGHGSSGTTRDHALVRYGTDGSLDPAFDGDGIVTTPVGTAVDQATGIALQADGRIVVVGHADGGTSQQDVVVARYHADPPPDVTPPDVQCGSADGAWHSADVSIACTASDAGSGLADPGDANFFLSTNVLAGTEDANASTDSRLVCDNAANCATAGPISGNMVDKKAPAISIVRPGAESYLLNQVVSASYSCSDGGSGIASCSGPVADGASLDTASVGTKGFTVDAADGVGNDASRTVTYVVAYDVFLLYDPAKSTRRIKVQLHDASGANVSDPTTALTVQSIDGSTGAGGTFGYSKGADGYVYVVDTRGLSDGSHTLEFTAGSDPTVHSVPFVVR